MTEIFTVQPILPKRIVSPKQDMSRAVVSRKVRNVGFGSYGSFVVANAGPAEKASITSPVDRRFIQRADLPFDKRFPALPFRQPLEYRIKRKRFSHEMEWQFPVRHGIIMFGRFSVSFPWCSRKHHFRRYRRPLTRLQNANDLFHRRIRPAEIVNEG